MIDKLFDLVAFTCAYTRTSFERPKKAYNMRSPLSSRAQLNSRASSPRIKVDESKGP